MLWQEARLEWKDEKSGAGSREPEEESLGALNGVGGLRRSYAGGGGEVTVMGVLLEAGVGKNEAFIKGARAHFVRAQRTPTNI